MATSLPDFFTIRKRLQENPELFEQEALNLYQYQYHHNHLYRSFSDHLNRNPANVKSLADLPFLPIQFFKSHEVCCFEPVWAERIYTSSSTGGQASRHFVRKYMDYELSFVGGFEHFFGRPQDWCILALLPSYLEREGSSLIEMCQHLMDLSGHPANGFYLNNHDALLEQLRKLKRENQATILIGVSFALLDLSQIASFEWSELKVIETGGMKGRRKEIIRSELHGALSSAFKCENIASEYGMTEMLSQAYSLKEGRFFCPPWLKIMLRESHDPLSWSGLGKSGGINVIDLANIDSCAFIATQDLGRLHADGSFEVLGRFDNSDIRGCNLMLAE